MKICIAQSVVIRFLSLILLIVCSTNIALAQTINNVDTTVKPLRLHYITKPVTKKSFIVPAALITTGALGISGEFIISNPEIKEERDEEFSNFKTNVDDYLQFAPIAAGYAMLFNHPDHSFWKYTEKVLLTEVMVSALVQPVKHLTKVPRPDTGIPTSFPSGHTAQAFAAAKIFCDEFAQHNTWLQVGVYSGAAAVGCLRILNNRHWSSDVVAGAGFGILSAKLSEWIIEPHGKRKHLLYTTQF